MGASLLSDPTHLSRLTRPQVEEMIRRITGGKRLPTEVVLQIVAKTDGVPLFVEELTRTVLEAGWLQEQEDRYERTGPTPRWPFFDIAQDALRARLDRLADGKAVAQVGAVLGRTFAYELLRPAPWTSWSCGAAWCNLCELRLQLALDMALQTMKGLGAPERGQVLTRAYELCQQVGDTPQLLTVLGSLASWHRERAEIPRPRRWLRSASHWLKASPMRRSSWRHTMVWHMNYSSGGPSLQPMTTCNRPSPSPRATRTARALEAAACPC